MGAPPVSIGFRQFVWLWNRSQGLGTPRLHLEIAAWLGDAWMEGRRHLLLLVFRSAGKSTLVGLFAAWLLHQDPNLRILVLSAEHHLARKMTRNVRRIIERHVLTRHLLPERTEEWASDRFTVRRSSTLRDPSLEARGITGNITGTRADVVICDDVEVPNTCGSEGKREELRERLTETSYVLVPGGLQLYVGTPHTYHSIYSDAPRPELGEVAPFLDGFERLCLPIIDEQGRSRWPERFGLADIERLRRHSGPAKFESQMLLLPRCVDDMRLDPARLVPYEEEIAFVVANDRAAVHLKDHRLLAVSAWWDPAFGRPDGGDSSVVAAVFIDDSGQYWLHDLRYLVHDPSLTESVDEATQLCRQVAAFAGDHHLPSIAVETNGIGRFLPTLLRRALVARGTRCRVDERTSRLNKDRRILDAFDPVLAARALHCHQRIWSTPFTREMQEWRPNRPGRDDGLDAVAGCLLTSPVPLSNLPPSGGAGFPQSGFNVRSSEGFDL